VESACATSSRRAVGKKAVMETTSTKAARICYKERCNGRGEGGKGGEGGEKKGGEATSTGGGGCKGGRPAMEAASTARCGGESGSCRGGGNG